MLHDTRTIMLYGIRTIALHDTSTIVLYDTRTIWLHDTRTIVLHDTRIIMLHGTRTIWLYSTHTIVLHGTRTTVLHDTRIPVLHGTRSIVLHRCTVPVLQSGVSDDLIHSWQRCPFIWTPRSISGKDWSNISSNSSLIGGGITGHADAAAAGCCRNSISYNISLHLIVRDMFRRGRRRRIDATAVSVRAVHISRPNYTVHPFYSNWTRRTISPSHATQLLMHRLSPMVMMMMLTTMMMTLLMIWWWLLWKTSENRTLFLMFGSWMSDARDKRHKPGELSINIANRAIESQWRP